MSNITDLSLVRELKQGRATLDALLDERLNLIEALVWMADSPERIDKINKAIREISPGGPDEPFIQAP